MNGPKVAILGGSFDPVHLGHLFLLHCAVTMTEYRSFLLIPAKLSNFKRDSVPKASDEDRLEMLRLALKDYHDIYKDDFVPSGPNPDIEISTMELDRGGVSFTSDTVRELKESGYKGIGLIMGDDHVQGLSRWHDFEYIRDNVEFLVCRRDPAGPKWDLLPKGTCFRRLEPSVLSPQSSSAFRSDTDGNQGYLSERVRDYVREKNLYN